MSVRVTRSSMMFVGVKKNGGWGGYGFWGGGGGGGGRGLDIT